MASKIKIKTYECLDCGCTFTANGMLGDKLCEGCGIEWWDNHDEDTKCDCNICKKLEEK